MNGLNNPGSKFTPSKRVNIPRFVLTLVVVTPIAGVLGTLYGYITLFSPVLIVSVIIGFVAFFMELKVVHWFFNKSESRHPTLTGWTIFLVCMYFWYCSFAAYLFEDFLLGDMLYGMYLRMTFDEVYYMVFSGSFWWTVAHIGEFVLMVVFPAIIFDDDRNLYCENCKEYLSKHNYKMTGGEAKEDADLTKGDVTELLIGFNPVTEDDFKKLKTSDPCLDIDYQTCGTCGLAVTKIQSGAVKPGDEKNDSKFEKDKVLCDRLVVNRDSKLLLDSLRR